MKRFLSLLMTALVLLGLGCAQKSTRPWYGSKIGIDAILKSDFCKKYQCQVTESLDYRKISKSVNWSYTLTTLYTLEFDDLQRSVGKGTDKISLFITFDKSNRLNGVQVQFTAKFGPPPYTYLAGTEAQYLTDLVAVALGKKYRYVPRDGDANPTDDMNTKCMTGIDLSKKVYRVLEQGKIAFEGETKARPYVAYCMVRPATDNPNLWPKHNQPKFAIYDSVYVSQ